jgi:glutamine amidotransferase
VLFDASDEAEGAEGLGCFAGRVVRLPDGLIERDGVAVKIPHMGWNTARHAARAHRALDRSDEWYYFVHSYHCVPEDRSVIAARTTHGVDFVSAVARDNVLAVQFHPEKSQHAGLRLLARWLEGADH